MTCFTVFWRDNEVLPSFLLKSWGTWACYIDNPAKVISAVKKSSTSLFSDCCVTNNEAPHFFLRNNEPLHFFLKKSRGTWACNLNTPANVSSAAKKIKHLVISSEKNEVPHYLFKNKSCFFSEELMRRLIFSEEIMRRFIVFWINNEALYFFWQNHEALDFFQKK